MDTYQFINELDVSYLHVFTYSERANTPAAEMTEIVPMEKRRERNEMLRILSQKKKIAFTQPYLGTIRKVLFEHSKDEKLMSGFTDNYIKVTLEKDESLINKIADVQLLYWDETCDTVVSKLV